MPGSEYLEAIILGIVQGIAEFLPISSSGHLTILQAIFESQGRTVSSESENLMMNVALHVGTLFSILWVYRVEWIPLLKRPWSWIIIGHATVPIVIVGFTFKDQLQTAFNTPLLAGCCLFGTALLLLIGQKMDRQHQLETLSEADSEAEHIEINDKLEELPLWKSGTIGLFQAFAILPGISRSGSTIAGGLMLGLSRPLAARFSFFLAIPAISGAAILMLKDFLEQPDATINFGPIIVGTVTSFIVGVLSLSWLLQLISRRKLHWFAWYCVCVATATIAWQLTI